MTGKHNKYIYYEIGKKGGKPVFRATLVEQSKYGCEKLHNLRAERGVGPKNRLDGSRTPEKVAEERAARG